MAEPLCEAEWPSPVEPFPPPVYYSPVIQRPVNQSYAGGEDMAENVMELEDAQFADEVETGEGVVVVDFWAPWCAPCRLVAPVIEALAAEYEGRVRFAKVNVDESPSVASRYGIRSIPTIGIFKDGEAVNGVVGAVPKQVLIQAIEEVLSAN